MRRASIVFGALLIALVVPLAALAGAQVPFKGADAGTWGEGTRDCGALFPVFVETSGQATHVGDYAYSSTECVDFGDSTYKGDFVIAAANGDTIEGTYAGTFQIVGSNIEYEQENAVTGGTGRFADATGSFHVSGVASLLADLSAEQELEGAISSVGSSK